MECCGLVGRHDLALGRPVRAAPDPAAGELVGRPAGGVHHDEVEVVAPAPDRDQPGAARRPLGLRVVGARVGQLPVARAVASHQMELVVAAALGGVGDRGPVGRPGRAVVVHPRRAGEGSHLAVVEPRHADLAAVEVLARGERVGDLATVRRDRGLALVAALVEVAVLRREAARPRVLGAGDREPGGVAALGLEHETRPVYPHRMGPLSQPARRPARHGHEPDVAPMA